MTDDTPHVAKMGLAQLNEFPDYCTRLERMEEEAKRPSRRDRSESDMSPPTEELRTGTFLGVPYDWRRNGFLRRLKQRWWNPAEPRLIVPKAFGWGYDLNLARLLGRKPKS